ncbi:MAG: carboxylesterase family protein [Planctomycetota bacterium]
MASERQTEHTFEGTFSKPVRYRYLLHLPKAACGDDGSAPGKPPMLLFLHGAGERGDDLELVKRHGPPKEVEQGRDLPFVIVSPQCEEGAVWDPDGLAALVDDVARAHDVDRSRIYVTGLSMGGRGTWELATRYLKRFAAIAPVCGWAHPRWARRVRRMGVWAFHGALDTVVRIEKTRNVIRELKKLDADVSFTVYPMAGHDSWTETYATPELYEWLLAHRTRSGGQAAS